MDMHHENLDDALNNNTCYKYSYEKDNYDDRSKIKRDNMQVCLACNEIYYSVIDNVSNAKHDNVCDECFYKKELSMENIVNKIRSYVQKNNKPDKNISSTIFFRNMYEEFGNNMNEELSDAIKNLCCSDMN